MGSILKNQILKHLSKFTKNLSPDKINISTLKGEGELSNLELDETILMNLMELPTWMKLKKAICNKVSIKVQWTKLKSQPIDLFLDEVVLEIETCPEPRPPNDPTQNSSYRSEGRYGFVDKVMDGIHVHINSVSVQFKSNKFDASLQLSRVTIQSLTPSWQNPTDIRQTRIRSESTDEILLFKEIDWQTTRIEANAHVNESDLPSTPLRLIANQSKIRIMLKKRLSDCSMLASRIMLLLDDLLWVLTDMQLKAAILYGNSLSCLIEKSTQQSKLLAAEKLQKQGLSPSNNVSVDQLLQQQHSKKQFNQTSEAKLFQKYDVSSTSYHLISSRIDLHLCDDTAAADKESSPKHNASINGGAMQIIFSKLSLDYYPYHFAGGERKNWHRYCDNQGSRNTWVQELFKTFTKEVTKAKQTCDVVSPLQSPNHDKPGDNKSFRTAQQQAQKPKSANVMGDGIAQVKNEVISNPMIRLLESCIVLRIEEFIIYRISTADNSRSTQKFLSSDKKALHLPLDMSMVHIEYTDYFYTNRFDMPVPHANLYVLINPIRLTVDYLTILWTNYFLLSLVHTVETKITEPEKHLEHVDVKIEAVMPRIVLSAEEKVENQPYCPDSLQIQISKLTVSNTQIENGFTLSDLSDLLEQYKACKLFESLTFPNDGNNISSIPKIFYDFANKKVNPYLSANSLDLVEGRLPPGYTWADFGNNAAQLLLKTNTLKRDMRCDLWCLCLDQIWMEFLTIPTSQTRPVPFVESFPITLWVCKPFLIPDGALLSTSVSENLSPKRSPEKNSDNDFETKHKQDNRRSRRLLKEYYSDESESTSPSDPNETKVLGNVEANSGNTNVHICDKQGHVQYSSFQVADTNIVAKIRSKVRAQLSNPQYLFLMRLFESITNFQMQLNTDITCLSKGLNTSANTFSVPLVIPEFELSIVCPFIAELLPLTNPANILCSPTSEIYEGQMVSRDIDSGYLELVREDAAQRSQLREQLINMDGTQNSILDIHHPDLHLPHSQSDSTITRHMQGSDKMISTLGAGVSKDSHSSEDVSVPMKERNFDSISQTSQIAVSDSGISSMGTALLGQRSRSGSKLTSATIKKSFASSVTNFSNFVGKKMKNKLDSDDLSDDLDSMSLRTDTSDDDDVDWTGIEDCDAPAFYHNNYQKIETASSEDTDDFSSVMAGSLGSRYKEMVSAVVFRLTGVELLIQSSSESMVVCLQVQVLDSEETGNIIYEELYEKLSAPNGVIRSEAIYNSIKYPLKCKFTTGAAAELHVPNTSELGLLDIKTKGFMLKFNRSSLLHLASFFQDEKIYDPVSIHVTVEDFILTLVEDRPSLRSEPATPDTVLNIHELFLYRHGDGVFHIMADNFRNEKAQTSEIETENSKITDIEQPVEFMRLDYNISSNDLQNDAECKFDLDLSIRPSIEEFQKMQSHNHQLKLLLSKFDTGLDKHEADNRKLCESQKQSDDTESETKLATSSFRGISEDTTELQKQNNNLMLENQLLKDKITSLETDLMQSLERIVIFEEDIKNKDFERESLLKALELMQTELMASEQNSRQQTFTGKRQE